MTLYSNHLSEIQPQDLNRTVRNGRCDSRTKWKWPKITLLLNLQKNNTSVYKRLCSKPLLWRGNNTNHSLYDVKDVTVTATIIFMNGFNFCKTTLNILSGGIICFHTLYFQKSSLTYSNHLIQVFQSLPWSHMCDIKHLLLHTNNPRRMVRIWLHYAKCNVWCGVSPPLSFSTQRDFGQFNAPYSVGTVSLWEHQRTKQGP